MHEVGFGQFFLVHLRPEYFGANSLEEIIKDAAELGFSIYKFLTSSMKENLESFFILLKYFSFSKMAFSNLYSILSTILSWRPTSSTCCLTDLKSENRASVQFANERTASCVWESKFFNAGNWFRGQKYWISQKHNWTTFKTRDSWPRSNPPSAIMQ